jgi:predicted metal-binding membrane protein
MSLFWMAAVAAAVFVEKTLPGGETIALVLGVLLVGLGFWVAASPSSVPGLTQPTPMHMQP